MLSSSEDTPLFDGGDAFRYTHPNKDNHIWVVVSDSFQNLTHLAVVNFTKWLKWKDQTCIVESEECPGVLTFRSCIEYAGSELLRLGDLEDDLDRGAVVRVGKIHDLALGRMRRGTTISQHTPIKVRQLMTAQGLAIESIF